MSHWVSWRRIAAVLALLTVGAVACGGDDIDQADVDTSEATSEATSNSRLLDADEFVDFLDTTPSAVLVNVHIPYEGHIEGTDAFVPFDEIGTWDGLPADRDAPIALYCRSGSMSAQAAATLQSLGYTTLVDLGGGMNAWVAAGKLLQTNG